MSVFDALTLLPKSVAISIASIIVGAGAFAGMEMRYVQASDFQKSYVLQLKASIREVRREIRNTDSEEVKELLEEELAELIEELCYEMPDDRECRE